MITHRGVRFSDNLPRPSPPPPPPQWQVPSFATKVPPPPPPSIPASGFVVSSLPTATGRQLVTPRKSPQKSANAGTGNQRYFSTQSACSILSPLSVITEITQSIANASPTTGEKPTQSVNESEKAQEKHENEQASNSFETLHTIDMLNFDFVNKCQCARDLGKIIRLLANKAGSPQLLQTARQRLLQVQGKKAPPPPPPPPRRLIAAATGAAAKPVSPPIGMTSPESMGELEDKSPGKIFTDSTANISRITLGNTTLDSIDASRNSLNLSYSPPSILRGLSLVETPNQNRSGMFSESRYTRLGTISEMSTSNQVTPPSASNKERLSEEVKKLSMDAVEMESLHAHENSQFVKKLDALQRAKHEAETLVRTLENKLDTATMEKEEAIKAMERIQGEQKAVRQSLQLERAKLQKRDVEARALEQRMQGKIAELQNALKEEVERSRLVIGAEKNLRLKQESDFELQRERNIELNQLLRQTKENLERIKRTQELFREELLKAFGESDEELKAMPQLDFITRMATKVRDIKAENTKLTSALKEAKAAPNQVIEERDKLQQRIREVLRANKALQEDNVQLGTKIEELSSEVISSRALIDKLLKTSHDTQTDEWEKKEAQYKSVIRNYQQQIRKQASTVSLELYKSVVDDSKRTHTQLQDAERKILDLQTKINNIEREGGTQRNTKTPNNNKVSLRSPFMSPTDFLEKGLLAETYQQSEIRPSPRIDLTRSAKKPRTPVSQLDLNLVELTSSGRKTDKQRSPIERIRVTTKYGGQSGKHPSNRAERTMVYDQGYERDDLTGMTICFQTPHGGLPSPGDDAFGHQRRDVCPSDTDVNTWIDRYNEKLHSPTAKQHTTYGCTPMESHYSAFGAHHPDNFNDKFDSPLGRQASPPLRPASTVGSEIDYDSTVPVVPTSSTKENHTTTKISPKSASKTLRMRKARELGGMKGLRSQLNKIRSPQSMGKPQRVVQVLGDRQVNEL